MVTTKIIKLVYLFIFTITSASSNPVNDQINSGCLVKEQRSEEFKPCQFPFVFKNKTYHGCTLFIGGKRKNYADEPWCSTKTDPITNEHISDEKYFGNCPTTQIDKSCPIQDCFVKEVRTETFKPCQFPFVWNGETYYSCTNKTARFGNGEFKYGNPWCSTKTDPITNEHVANRRFHGDCKTEFCPSDEIEQMKKEAKQTYEFFINKCTEKDEMPYYNQILKQYECYPLLSQGPCDPGYWLILDKDQPNKAVCAEELCLEKDFEDYDDNPIVYYNGCKNKYDILYDDICPYGQELMTNAFGEGECDCIEGFLPYIEENESVSCYQEFLQGPCPQGQEYSFPDEDTQDIKPACIPTGCENGEILYENQCIPAPTCEDPNFVQFQMNRNTSVITTTCVHLTLGGRTQLISGIKRCGPGKRLDARGNCKKGVGFKRKNKRRRQAITYGRGRNVRDICCNG